LDWHQEVRRRLAALTISPAREAEIVEELAQHLGDVFDEARAAGADHDQARRRALEELDHGALVGELLRAERPATEPMPPIEGRGGSVLETVWQDVRHGVRVLRRNPLFTLVVVVTLGLGVGANTATFSVLHALLIRPLPYQDPERVLLALGWDTRGDRMRFNIPISEGVRWMERTRSFEHAGAYQYWSANLTGAGDPERLQAYRVTANLFALLGVEPAIGRGFRVEEGRPGAAGVAVLSHAFWRRRLGGDPAVVGRTILLDDEPHTIIGVMPPRFEFPQVNYKGDLWAPMRFDSAEYPLDQPSPSVVAVARLRRDLPLARAQAELDGIYSRLVEENPRLAGRGVRLMPMRELFSREAGPVLWTLMAAVGFVLLIACANVANLLVSRAPGRQSEIAVRSALGASRRRLVRQMLTESLLVGLGGGAFGVALAYWATAALRGVTPDWVVVVAPAVVEIGVNRAVLMFALGAALVTALLFGVLPAVRASRPALSASLREGSPAVAGRSRHRLSRALVVLEVALSLVLLAGAGLLLRSLSALLRTSPGFDPDNVLVAEVSLPTSRYPEERRQAAFFERAVERAASLPGVEAAAVVNRHPFSTSNTGGVFLIAGRPEPEAGDLPRADYREVSPDYFRALRIPLVAGRGVTPQDSAGAPRIVIVNRAFVRRFFAGGNALGAQIRFGNAESTDPWRTIVGVVGDVRHWSVRRDVEPEAYVPLAQNASPRMTLVVRSTGDPMALVPALRAELRAVDPDQPIYNVEPMRTTVERAVFGDRSATVLMIVFAGLALVLAGVGLYGVISTAVSQRRHEIGIRMALGAQPGDVLRLVLGTGGRLALTGLILGLGATVALGRVLGGLLFGVKPADPLTLVAVALVLGGVALAACYVPARRATRVDPMVALRYE
jgi:putative ABC transport system permease protein